MDLLVSVDYECKRRFYDFHLRTDLDDGELHQPHVYLSNEWDATPSEDDCVDLWPLLSETLRREIEQAYREKRRAEARKAEEAAYRQ